MAPRRAVSHCEAIMCGEDDERLSARPAADFLGIAEDTLRKWARQGRIRHFIIGRRIEFSKRDLRAFLAECERPVGR